MSQGNCSSRLLSLLFGNFYNLESNEHLCDWNPSAFRRTSQLYFRYLWTNNHLCSVPKSAILFVMLISSISHPGSSSVPSDHSKDDILGASEQAVIHLGKSSLVDRHLSLFQGTTADCFRLRCWPESLLCVITVIPEGFFNLSWFLYSISHLLQANQVVSSLVEGLKPSFAFPS